MAKEIKMPQLSDTMDSGKILSWFKQEGDSISRGDILAEVETDKANLEIESFDTGTLLKVVIPADNTANVGETIAVIGEAGESFEISTNGDKPANPAPKEEPSPQPVKQEVSKEETKPEPVPSSTDRIKVSPLAKKIASEQNIDLKQVQGSGPNGRIIKKDLSATQAATPKATPALGGQTIELDKMRSTIARRMQESMQQSPHFYMTSVINMAEAKKLREALKVKEDFKGLSLNHFIIKATALALAKVPAVNAAMQGDKLYQPDQVNVGVITAVENGLLIPVIHQADQMKLKDLVFEVRAAISRARAGRPTAQDLSGGTFSISNMGMYDVENFTAIINPGQGAILAVSSMKEKAIVQDGKLGIGLEMKVTLSVDHRIIDGVDAGTFLKHLKENLETPAFLLI